MARGLTLVEVTVALLLGSIVLLTGHALFEAASAGRALTEQVATVTDELGRGQLLLGRTIMSLDVGSGQARSFRGGAAEASFHAWIPNLAGVPELRPVRMLVSEGRLIATLGTDTVIVRTEIFEAVFEYLIGYGLEERWRPDFESDVTAPTAIRVRLGNGVTSDTLLFSVGVRG